MKQTELVKTLDGSLTLYFEALDEHFHSTKGAVQESMHVFIKNGFDFIEEQRGKSNIEILEVGLGTGLNVLLTLLRHKDMRKMVSYTAIEKYPLSLDIIEQLNYNEYVDPEIGNKLLEMHQQSWEQWHPIDEAFLLRKVNADFCSYLPDRTYDLIYFDAFAPDKQPEMWSETVFQRLYEHLNDQGVCVTYSAKGMIKRRLKSVGFIVETRPGPPGKREMIRALKSS